MTMLASQIEAAKAYESLFVPALFGTYAPIVADAAALQPGWRVLDVACGTGVLAREAAARVGTRGAVVGVDPVEGMLAVARELAPALEWRAGVAEALDFPTASFDAVVSQFGMMFFTDRPCAIRELLRVAKPGARLAVAVWDAIAHNAVYAAEAALFERFAGTPAAEAVRAPFVLGDAAALAALVRDAGAVDVDVDTHRCNARFPSVRTMVEADLRGWLPVMGVALDEATIARVIAAADAALAPAITAGEAGVTFETSAHVVRARVPG
jgi:SAM-dependent methyltransferase